MIYFDKEIFSDHFPIKTLDWEELLKANPRFQENVWTPNTAHISSHTYWYEEYHEAQEKVEQRRENSSDVYSRCLGRESYKVRRYH